MPSGSESRVRGISTRPCNSRTAAKFADAIPLGMDIAENMVFEKGNITAHPRSRQLMRADFLVYRMLKDSYPTRPLYFSRTSGGYPYELGLEQYVVTQGMAKKVVDHIIVPGKDTILVPGEGYVDVPRSKALWDQFTATKSLAKRNGWVDDASVGIPDLYVISGLTFAEALARTGQMAASDSVFLQAKAVAKAMRREKAFGIDKMITMPAAPADTALSPLLAPPPAAAPPAAAPVAKPPLKKP